jgi:gluconolactonase
MSDEDKKRIRRRCEGHDERASFRVTCVSQSRACAVCMFLLVGLTACSRSSHRIERRDPDLDRILPAGARVETLAGGFGYTEGPVWVREGFLLFADLPNNVIRKWAPGGAVTVVRTRSGYADADKPPGASMGSNGMALDAEGRLTICEPGNRRVTRLEADGRLTVLADRYEGRRLNSPNDLVYKSDGSLYFTDPPHGLIDEDRSPQKELDFNGIFRVVGGELQLLSKEMTRPNGLAFSPDEKFLYVANSDWQRKIWMRYEVGSDGSLSNGTVFLDLSAECCQAPDGMKVDREGNLYCTGPGGIWILAPSGKILGIIRTRHEPSNCAWGDADRRALYITGRSEIYRIRVAIPGAGGSIEQARER